MNDRREIDRLTARLDRERRARREAERIAERGLRELWELNRDLDARVAERTAGFERELASLARWHEVAVADVADAAAAAGHSELVERIGWIALTAGMPLIGGRGRATMSEPVVVADRVTDRWQRTLARSGHLMSIDVDRSMPAVAVRWDVLLAALDLVLVGIDHARRGGAVRVGFQEVSDPRSLVVSIVRSASTDIADDELDQVRSAATSTARLLAVATGLVERHGGRLRSESSPDGDRIELSVPIDDERQVVASIR